MDQSSLKCAGDALSDAFQTGFESVHDGLKKTSLPFVESKLTDLALKGALESILNPNLEKCAHSSNFMDLFNRRVLKSTYFLPPAANFIRKNVEEQSGKLKSTKR